MSTFQKPAVLPSGPPPSASNLGGVGMPLPQFVPPLVPGRPNPGVVSPSGEPDNTIELLERIYKNEAVFVRRLDVLCTLFARPLLHDAKTLKPKIIVGRANIHAAVFFTSLSDILTLETNFLEEMKAAEGDIIGISRALVKNAPLRRIYAAFVSKFDVLFEHLTSAQTASNPAFAEFLDATAAMAASETDDTLSTLELTSDWVEHAKADPIHSKVWLGASLGSKTTRSKEATNIMRHMVQLLAECWTHLNAFDAAVDNIVRGYVRRGAAPPAELQNAKVAGQRTQMSIEHEQTIAAQRSLMRKLEGVWGMALTKPGRLLIKSGYLTKVSRKSNIRYAFLLFSDVMMYGAESTSVGGILETKVTHHRTLELEYTKIVAVHKPLAFQILSSKSFEVVCDDEKEHQSWFTLLQEATAKAAAAESRRRASRGGGGGLGGGLGVSGEASPASPSSAAAAVWRQDREVKQCHICSKGFTTLRRRHHCRRCGEVVCDACSKCRVPENQFLARSSASDKLTRVCDDCVMIINQAPGAAKADVAGGAVAAR